MLFSAYVIGNLYGGDATWSWYPNTFNAAHRAWLEGEMWYQNDHVNAPAYDVPSYAGLSWSAVDTSNGQTAPSSFWVGGNDGATPLGLCTSWLEGGQHPGKLIDGGCSFPWGNAEHWAAIFRVLQVDSSTVLRWVARASGQAPPANAIASGYEHGAPLYACRGPYGNGTHPGKVVWGNCDIGYGGQEVVLTSYEVLCQPSTCQKLGVACGQVDDGCGGLLHCPSSCGSDEVCAGNACVPKGCVPRRCQRGWYWNSDDCACEPGLPK
jgi:hypothetical protein